MANEDSTERSTAPDTGVNGPFGGLSPSEAGKKSAEARRRAKMDGADLLEELEKAAKGLDDWVDLAVDKRLQALVKCIEYKIGRPLPMRQGEEESEGTFTVGTAEVPKL